MRADLVARTSLFMGSAREKVTAIPGLTIYRRPAPAAPAPVTYEPSIAIVLQGRKRVELRQATLLYDESRFLLTSLDLPVLSGVVQASEEVPYLCMLFTLEMPLVRELLNLEMLQTPGPVADGLSMVTSATTLELLDCCRRSLDLLDTPQDIPVLSGLIKREMIYRVLQGPAGARLRAVATHGDQSHRTARTIAWIKTNYAKPLRVQDLAAMAGMGSSTFHRHFQALTTMSPLQYQKQIRLQAARGHMLVDRMDVASAAFAVGYESVSQFTREYGRLFGQPPTRDLRSLRAGSDLG